MNESKPPITGTTHTLPFDKLSPADFERLSLWLVQREGFERAEHLGLAGSEQGRDVVAYRPTSHGEELWYFQCKRYRSIHPATLKREVDKYLELAQEKAHLRPAGVIFVVSCAASAKVREDVGHYCQEHRLAHKFWALTELDEKVKRHPDIVEEFFQPTQTVIHRGVEIAVPSPDAVACHRAALRQRLEADARARWGGMAVYIQEEGAALPIDASPYQSGRLGPRESLLRVLHAADRLLILGEPGSGKTVSLQRLAWELCDGPGPTIPILVPLFRYAGTPLHGWVRAFLRETDHLRLDDDRALEAFLAEGDARCFFLFDGLNEVAPDYRDRLVDELVRWAKAHPRHPIVLTSRSQDELWRRIRSDLRRVLVVQPITDEQARHYLVEHLEEQGDELYGRLDERLRAMARTPLILWLIKEAGAVGESIPGNRGELHARFVSRMLRRDTDRRMDRRMDAEIPERVKRQALAVLAYHLGQGKRLSCPRDEAIAVVAQRLGEDLINRPDDVVGACARHGLLAGEDTVWFAPHQTVQEHFAALALRDIAQREWRMGRWARLQRSARRLLSGKEEGLAALAADDWWMETFVQLAGLMDEADWLALEVARVNPWLAWWCVEEGRGVTGDTQEAVADRSVRLLESRRVSDRRRAVAALAQVRSERVVQPLLRAAADPDPEVAGLAVQALTQMGEAARPAVKEALEGTDQRLRLAALRYLLEAPDHPLCYQVPWEKILGQPMAWIPFGPFAMGSDDARDPQASDRELPQHQVTLPGYWIGRYPVTVAQFRAFVEASDQRPADSVSLKGPDDHPVVNVTWRDALAFCRWLSERAGLPVTLPSEAQWEKAARGTDGSLYPWGDAEPTPDLCNFDMNEGGTTPVGKYSPEGDSPYGCADMAGNVWEWCRTKWEGSYEDYQDDNDLSGDVLRVLRGDSFVDPGSGVRCADRFGVNPDYRDTGHGFRLVASPYL